MAATNEVLSVICLGIKSPERGLRIKGLKELLAFCELELTDENCLNVFDYVYLHALKCYSDDFEKCRSLATSVITLLLTKLPKNDFFLNYIIPAIALRVGQQELVEQSEEMRLQWLDQLGFIVDKYWTTEEDDKDYLLKSYNDLIDILKQSLLDSCPENHRKACEVVIILSNATPSFHYQAESLVKPCSLLLKQKQSASRIAAIGTLGVISMYITTNSECIVKILEDIVPMVMDSSPFVRRECGRVGCKMMLDLRDRYSFFDRILPLVFSW